MRKEDKQVINGVIGVVGAVASVLAVWILAWPKYVSFRQDWQHQLEAQQVQHEAAMVEQKSAIEVAKAKTTAEVSQIIGEAMVGNEAYLLYLWADSVHRSSNSVIYVPTEGHMPSIGASRQQLRPAVFPPDNPIGNP